MILLDDANISNALEDVPVIVKRLTRRINEIESVMATTQAQGSSNNINYDPRIGETITQRRFRTF